MKEAGSINYCSSCFGQYADKRYVDLEAYWDGPVIENGDFKVPIDDLILCEDCLKQAGALVDLYPSKELKEENVELGIALERKNEEIISLHEYLSDLEKTYSKLADEKIQRPARKPKMVEV